MLNSYVCYFNIKIWVNETQSDAGRLLVTEVSLRRMGLLKVNHEDEEADTFFGVQMLGLKRPLDVVRKLVTTQRRASLQRLSSSITNLSEVLLECNHGFYYNKPERY